MLLDRVIETSRQVAATPSRLAKIEALARTLAEAVIGREVEVVADYLAGVLPQRRVGVSWRGLRSMPRPAAVPTLSVLETDEHLARLAAVAGQGSAATRSQFVAELFGRATETEQRWLRGLVTGEVRQGAGDGVLLQAIAAAAGVSQEAVRRAVMLTGYAGPVAAAALAGGEDALAGIHLEVGRPLRPMLASSAPDVAEALEGRGELVLDSKLDGIRIQAHKIGADVRLFTRTLDDVTERMPEAVEELSALPAEQAVFDGEVIALHPDGRPHPFQVTGARTASSADPERLRNEVPLTTYLFDLLHLDGQDLLDEPFARRWDALATLAPHLLVPRTVTGDVEEARAFFTQRVGAGHEGVVVKDPAAAYAAGRRGGSWVKVKPRHTVDLVVLAVEWGSGRRTGLLSNIHLGARDETTGKLVMLGKTFKGMTDETLAWQTQRFTELKVDDNGWVVTVRPEQVVEIAFDGVQRSTRYPGGIALRFARVLRYRDDKPVSEIDTLQSLQTLA